MVSEIKRGFKKKTIEKTIKHKINSWLNTIDNEELKVKIKRDYILTGGAIASMLQGDLPNDYDLYFSNIDTAVDVVNYYVNKCAKSDNTKVPFIKVEALDNRVVVKIKSAGIVQGESDNQADYEYFESTDGSGIESYLDESKLRTKEKYGLVMITSNAISLNDDIQIVTRFVGNPEHIHLNFDFVHATNWFTEAQGVILNSFALESILTKELRYVGSLYPICSMFRTKKFIERGWTITAGEMLKIAWDINRLNLDDIDVLNEQLTGVDVAYFNQIINILKTEKKDLDRTYLFELINRVFDGDLPEDIIKGD